MCFNATSRSPLDTPTRERTLSYRAAPTRITRPANRPARWGGFSLVEIMVVLVIIGLLAGVVTINVRGYMVRANQNAAKAEIATICNALETFYLHHNRYPTNEEGLEILTTVSDASGEAILSRLPNDPWGNPYQYNTPGRDGPYEVLSLGADGRDGGEGADRILGSWELDER